MFTNEELMHLREGLKRLIVAAVRGDLADSRTGICATLNTETYLGIKAYAFVRLYSEGWRHHTGDPHNPIPPNGAKWAGVGLHLRVDLMQYMLKRIEAELCGE